MFLSFQSSRTSPDWHNFSKMMDSSSAALSASSLRDPGWTSLGPMICAHSGYLDGLKPDPLQRAQDLHPRSPCICLFLFGWYGWSTCHWRQAQKSLRTPTSSLSRVARSPVCFQIGPILPLVFLLLATYVWKPFQLSLVSCTRGFALLGTVNSLTTITHLISKVLPYGFQTTSSQINSIILILKFNIYVKIAYVVHFAYFLHFIFSQSNFIKAIWQENTNSVDCSIELSAPLGCPVLGLFVLGFVAVVSPTRPITLECCQICCCCSVSLMVHVGAGVMRTWPVLVLCQDRTIEDRHFVFAIAK